MGDRNLLGAYCMSGKLYIHLAQSSLMPIGIIGILKKKLNYVYVCGSLWLCAHDCQCSRKPVALDSPGAGVSNGCELPSVSAGN